MSDQGDLLSQTGAFSSGDHEMVEGDAALHIVEESLLF